MDVFKQVTARIAFSSEKMKKVNLFTTDRMFCDVYCFEPGQEQTPHTHTGSDKIYYVLNGRATVRVGQETRELGAGDIAIAPSGAEHGVSNTSADQLTVLVFMAPKPS